MVSCANCEPRLIDRAVTSLSGLSLPPFCVVCFRFLQGTAVGVDTEVGMRTGVVESPMVPTELGLVVVHHLVSFLRTCFRTFSTRLAFVTIFTPPLSLSLSLDHPSC
jgi:hypothetical protein